MTPFIVNENSWHYHLATKYGNMKYWLTEDICTYTQSVILGLIKAALMTLLLAVVVGSVVSFWMYLLVSAIVGHIATIENGFGMFGGVIHAIVFGAIAVVNLVLGFEWCVNKITGKVRAIAHTGFVKAAYRSWKDKYCIRVEFK